MTTSVSLVSVPQEVLEHIAFFAATHGFVGPPSGLPSLLLTCRNVHQTLSLEANPLLYARIFSSKFDTCSASRRLGSYVVAPRVLADELKRRCMHLKQIRSRTNSRIRHAESYHPSQTLTDLLWLAYLMMLENDGKNEQQLLDYAKMDDWLMEYWFDTEGASEAVRSIFRHDWPIEDERNSIAMWLFWFLLRPDFIKRNMAQFPHMTTIIKLIALAANHYPICHLSWTAFLPRSGTWPNSFPRTAERELPFSIVTHFSQTYRLNPPALAPAAILAFLTLKLRILVSVQANNAGGPSLQFPASYSLTCRRSEDWDADWYRCINLGPFDRHEVFSEVYVLGSMEGVWEGIFTYTEFSAYATLLSGAPPPVFEQCLVAHHRQTWKLREYYLVEQEEDAREDARLLSPGDPLKAYFPARTSLQELSDCVEIQEPGRDAIFYRRLSRTRPQGQKVIDIVILGEGHSAWGQFNLYGRVRPLDGFMSISKEYVEDERGRWLYRGYLVGNVDGHLSGRWRDTMSPSNINGYEGCFVMSRRR